MPEPIVYDARQGLSQPAIDDLSRAVRLDLTAKTASTTVVGCWVRGADPQAEGGEELRAIVLEGDCERGGESGQVISLPIHQHTAWPEEMWRLQAGDQLRAKWIPNGVVLEVERAGEKMVLLSVHSESSESPGN